MIKWGFFWKFLKQLFIISLISCFILLGNSFVNAGCIIQSSSNSHNMALCDNNNLSYYYSWSNYFVGWISDYKLNFNDWIFKYDVPEVWNVLSYWWGLWSLNYTVKNYYWNWSSNWTINWFYYHNWTVWNDPLTFLSGRGYDFYSFDKLRDFLDDSYKYVDYYCAISNYDSNPYCIVCLTQWTDLWHICIDRSNSTYNSSSFIDVNQISQESTKNPFFKIWTSYNPSTGSRLGWRLNVSKWYTNSDMVEGFECVGLQPALCYWWFPIDNIFQPWEQFEDFTWYVAGQGASVFDLYSLYSWSFSNLNQFLNTVLTRYKNWQINSFITEPKALIMLGAQMNTAWFKTSYISSYCNLLINNNNTNLYTWDSVDDLRVQSCLRNKKAREWLKDSEWRDVEFQSTHSWIFSWDDVDFDPDTFFSSLMEKITENLDNPLNWGFTWLIPWYIIVFTLALIFIRIISH